MFLLPCVVTFLEDEKNYFTLGTKLSLLIMGHITGTGHPLQNVKVFVDYSVKTHHSYTQKSLVTWSFFGR
jgi:hypothetical protein